MTATDKSNRIGWWIVLAMGALVLLSAIWVVYAGPAWKKHRAEEEIAAVHKLFKNDILWIRVKDDHWQCFQGFSCVQTSHWLGLEDIFPEPLREWQKNGGIPRLSINIDAAAFTPAEHQEFYQRLQRLQIKYLGIFNATEADLRFICQLPKLSALKLSGTMVTDSWLKELGQLPEMETLDLSETAVTDAGVKELDRCRQLIVLDLSKTMVTDAGLKGLGHLSKLQVLDLSKTQITDTGLKEFCGLRELCDLKLSQTAVTGTGLKELVKLPELKAIRLSGSAVTDAGMKEISNLSNLELLKLDGITISDTGLQELAKMPKLHILQIGPSVSPEAIKQLKDNKKGWNVNVEIILDAKEP